LRGRGSVVDIATGYGLDDIGAGVRVPVGSRIFFCTGPGVDSASNRNEYRESLKKIKKPGGKVRLARRTDNLAAIY
jgi:hypothetical protein